MRFVLAPDKFKGTFTAAEVCRHLAAGILRADPSAGIVEHPMADGGEGTLEILAGAAGGALRPIDTCGPFGEPLREAIGLLPGGIIVLESARICGLGRVAPERRDPRRATSRGFGLALREALAMKPAGILAALGGTATLDGGLGALIALGWTARDRLGRALGGEGRDLFEVASLEPPDTASHLRGAAPIRLLCDVENPLLGPFGAARVFGPQKGADAETVQLFEEALERWVALLERGTEAGLGFRPGTGAAGGLGAALAACLGGTLESGAEGVMALTSFEARAASADLIVTGEGAVQARLHQGKVVGSILAAARRLGRRVAVVCGRWEGDRPARDVEILEGGPRMEVPDLVNAGKILARRALSG